MAGTFASLTYHLVFSTKNRQPWIIEPLTDELYQYMGGIIREHEGHLIEIGGVSDHVHLLTTIPAKLSVSEMLKTLKAGSSRWVNETKAKLLKFGWQDGYAAFTVSRSGVPGVQEYIRGQREHHARWDYRAELVRLLIAHEIEFEERYLD